MGKAEDDVFEIELEGIKRDTGIPFEPEVFEVTFSCLRYGHSFEVSVWLEVDEVTTTEIVLRAMSEAHKAFAVLAEQTRAWLI